MSGKQSILRTIVNRNVERQLVKEFLMDNTKTAGFGGLTINPVSYTHLTLPTT